jgi:hypothetical protein
MYIRSIHEPGEQNIMVGFGLYHDADRSNLVVIWRHVVNGRKSVSDKLGGMCAWKRAAVEWKLYRVGFNRKSQKA